MIWGYRPRYYLTHPLTFLKEPWHVLMYFFQRGKRGWAISDTWSADVYIARVIADICAHLATHTWSTPYPFFEHENGHEEYQAYLKELALAFHEYVNFMTDVEQYGDDMGDVRYQQYIERMKHLFDHYATIND